MEYQFVYRGGNIQEWGKCLHLHVVEWWNIVQVKMLHWLPHLPKYNRKTDRKVDERFQLTQGSAVSMPLDGFHE